MINLTEQEIKDLMKFIDDMPTKFGLPLVQFFSSKIEEQKQDEQGEN